MCLKIPERIKSEVKTMFRLLLALYLKLRRLKPQNHLMTHQFLRCIHDFEDLQSAGNISSVGYNLGCLYSFESRIQINNLSFETKWAAKMITKNGRSVKFN